MPIPNLTLPLNLMKAMRFPVKRTVCPTFTWMRRPSASFRAVLARFVLDFFGFRFLLRTLLDWERAIVGLLDLMGLLFLCFLGSTEDRVIGVRGDGECLSLESVGGQVSVAK